MDPFASLATGDVDVWRAAVAADAGIASAVNDDGIPIVRMALYMGRRDLADVLLTADPPLDVFDVAAIGDAERLETLLDHDLTRVTAVSSDGFTALHLAAFLGGVASVQVLLRHGADTAAVARNAMRVQPLHSAIAGGHEESAMALIRAGAPVDAAQQGGYRPLHEAAHHGNRRLVAALLAAGADASARTDEGATASDLAEAAGYHELAAALAPR